MGDVADQEDGDMTQSNAPIETIGATDSGEPEQKNKGEEVIALNE